MTHLDGSLEHPPPPKKQSWKEKTLSEFFTRPVRYVAIGLVVFVGLILLAS